MDGLTSDLQLELEAVGYKVVPILVSGLLQHFEGWTAPPVDEIGRIEHLQKFALEARVGANDGALLARAAIVQIRNHRLSMSGNPDKPEPSTAYVLRQIKTTSEIDLLRSVYGPAFYLIAGHLREESRIESLVRAARAHFTHLDPEGLRTRAGRVVDADSKEPERLGQNTRDAIPQADLIVDLRVGLARATVGRFVELIFGHPFHSPTRDEHSMFQAFAVSLRSADYNRQVGAAIIQIAQRGGTADVLAVGMNEVPRRGGGYYWTEDSPDSRDQNLESAGLDRPESLKLQVLTQILARLSELKLLADGDTPPATLAKDLWPHLDGTLLKGISEFSRPVHAEMAALLDAARRGVAVDGQLMFVTTFPCHNCAKHIIAAGIQRVVFLEPYPKSRASYLYPEEICFDPTIPEDPDGKVVFSVFLGIGPRLYSRLFSMSERGAKRGIVYKKWDVAKRAVEPILVPSLNGARVVEAERQELSKLDAKKYTWDSGKICP